jgi:hypothetical protein
MDSPFKIYDEQCQEMVNLIILVERYKFSLINFIMINRKELYIHFRGHSKQFPPFAKMLKNKLTGHLDLS